MDSNGTALVIWDPKFREYDFGPHHPFQQTTRELAVRLLDSAGGFRSPRPARRVDAVDPAPLEALERFHHRAYLDLVAERSERSKAPPFDSGDTPAFPGCFGASARIVGGALRAVEALVRRDAVRAFHPSGGLHHAHPDAASGFCIFNDIAVAIASAVGPGRPFARAAYLDLDAHHGDGVMYGFYESGRVLDIDFHQDGRTLFPGTGRTDEIGVGDGAGFKVNLPLPPGSGDGVLVGSFRRVVPTLLRTFRPEIIILQHGVDGHAGDRLAGLRYSAAGYSSVLNELLTLADELCQGRILVTGGGGYTPGNVSRVLAMAGLRLADRAPPAGPLPERWRQEFASVTGESPPVDWTDPPPAPSGDGAESVVEFLAQELSERLGVKFPRPDSAPTLTRSAGVPDLATDRNGVGD